LRQSLSIQAKDRSIPKMTDVAIVGASGYAALELIRILLRHPHARITAATSRQDERPRLDSLHPSLAGRIDVACQAADPDRLAEAAELAFLALPHAASLAIAPQLRKRGMRVIDLSADYRLKDAAVYADWYDHVHTDAEGLSEAVYGLPELFRDRIAEARLVANPGCYTSTAILALAPLLAEGRIDPKDIIIDAKSGVSGAGRSPKLAHHFPECNESLSAYGVGRHRHTPEIEQVLTEMAGEPVEVIFTPHLVPMDRGILATIYATPRGETPSEHELMDLYRRFYAEAPFVRVVEKLPATKDSAHSNFFDVTARIVRGKIVLVACLDNLIKGAAGVAVQNFNLMTGRPEVTSLL
jgi:N-acetyl-gamma-glutamyl-phosphate reductase